MSRGFAAGWSGKLTGGLIGFLFSPAGAFVGLFIGHLWDVFGPNVVRKNFQAPNKTLFFNTAFAVMGHLAKADGRVTQAEIQLAEQVMAQLRLDGERRQEARAMFSLGKAPTFNLTEALAALEASYSRAFRLKLIFLQLQMSAAWADGEASAAEYQVLREVARVLRIPQAAFRQVEALVAGMARRAGGARAQTPGRSEIATAYQALGVSPSDSDTVIKRAYRRLISKHHPDKLVSKGLPEDMLRAATERTVEIKASYDLVMANRADGR